MNPRVEERGRARWRIGLGVWIAVGLIATGMVCRGEDAGNAICASCHEVATKVAASAHASVSCASCHVKHEEYPHAEGVPKPECGSCHKQEAADYSTGIHAQEAHKGNAAAPDCGSCHAVAHETQRTKSAGFRTAVPETCGMCHSDIATEYKGSVHGKAVARGVTQAPVCTDCHGEHSILPKKNAASSVNGRNVAQTCGRCHGDVKLARRFGLPTDRLVTFEASFHGLAAKSGSETVANCASCHGVHTILPSSDVHSKTNLKNLATTCGQCHPGAGQRFAIAQIHMAEGGGNEPPAVAWVRSLYLLLIPGTIGLMMIHNAGDWARKLYKLRLSRASKIPVVKLALERHFRMFAFERVQHALLVISFLVLVWSGFALKYPSQWWARPILLWEGSAAVRSLVHRIAGVAFIAVSVMHVISLIVNAKLRHHWQEIIPALRDIGEAAGGFAYNLGLRKQQPHISEHSYMEKAEYWAVVWGAIVMIATGILLWANNLAMTWLPKSVLDVAVAVHFYEAILAALAILVWHIYSVIFDPDVYPLDPALITGYSTRQRNAIPDAADPSDKSSH